jgi:hypothetical protein
MKALLLLALLSSSFAFARQGVTMAPINFQVSTDHGLSKFDQVISNPERILRRYRPEGVRVSNKNVSRNEISFTATKTVFMISKSVYVHGVLETGDDNRSCSNNETGYRLRMHFESSDHLVTNNVDELRALICVRELSAFKIAGQIRPQIILGERYSKTLGPMAINLIKDQVSPMLTALTEEIKAMR